MPSVLLLEESGWGGVHTMTRTLQDALGQTDWQVTALPWKQTPFTQLINSAKAHDVIVGTHNFGPTYCGAALKALSEEGTVPVAQVAEAIKKYGIKTDKINPLYA